MKTSRILTLSFEGPPITLILFLVLILGVQCGVEEALRSTREYNSAERSSARHPANVRNQRAITMGRNHQLVVDVTRSTTGDVRELDKRSDVAGTSSETVVNNNVPNITPVVGQGS